MSNTPKTLFDKLWDAHRVPGIGAGSGPAFDDDSALLLIDRILLHERMGSIALIRLDDAHEVEIVDDGRLAAAVEHFEF